MNKLFTKIAALALGATMAVGVGVAVASNSKVVEPVSAATATKTGSWDLTSSSSDFTSSNCVTYFSQPYGMKKKDAYIQTKTASDFSTTGTTQIKVGIKCLQNGGTTSRLTVTLVNSSGTTIGSGVVITPVNASAASSTTFQYATFTSNLTGAYGFNCACTTFGKNILINGANYEVTYTTGGTTYTVSYDANGGTGTMTDSNSPYNSGATVTVLSNTFTRDGYTFDHWNTAADNTGTTYNPNGTFSISANTTLYAQWEEDTGDALVFNLSSNPGGWPTDNETTLTDYTYTLSSVTYTFSLKNVKCNSGYLMCTYVAVLGLPAIQASKLTKVVAYNSGGCSTSTYVGVSSSSSSESYITGGNKQNWSTQGSSYTYNLSGTAVNTQYYLYVTGRNAQITKLALTYEEIPTYTVSFAVNTAGYGTVSQNSITGVPSGSSISVSNNTVTINGTTVTATPTTNTDQYTYAFSDWSNASETVTAARTITANFTRTTNSFTVDDIGIQNGSLDDTSNIEYGGELDVNVVPASGYTYPNNVTVTMGGNDISEDVQYEDGYIYYTPVTGNIVVSASCVPEGVAYTVTYNANSGTVSPTSEQIAENAHPTFPIPTRSGYNFKGWQVNGSGTAYTDPEDYTVTGDVTFVASWAALYTVTFDSNGGSSSPTAQSVEDGSTFSFPSAGTKTHYTFDGWTSTGSAPYYAVGATSPAVTAAITYTAHWTEDAKVTVTYSAGTHGSGNYLHTNQYVGSYTLLTFNDLSEDISVDSGYRFKNYTVGGIEKNPGDFITLNDATEVTVNFELIPVETTYDFVSGFSTYASTWQTSYDNHTGLDGEDDLGGDYAATVDLYKASKQTGSNPILDRPVFATKTDTGYTKVLGFSLDETGYTIEQVVVTFKQWNTKTPSVALFSGATVSGTALDTATIGTKNTLSVNDLGGVEFSIGYCDGLTSNVQSGLTSIYITLKQNVEPSIRLDKTAVTGYTTKTVQLAYASSENMGEITSYQWSITSGGNYVSLSGGTTSSTVTISCTAVGSAVVRLTASDGTNTAYAEATVTVHEYSLSISWDAPSIKVYSGSSLTASQADSWGVKYTDNAGHTDEPLDHTEFSVKLDGSVISLPHVWSVADDGLDLCVSYDGEDSSTVTVSVTQSLRPVIGNVDLENDSDLTFTSGCGGSGTADDGKTWTITSDAAESTYDPTKGIHYGTGSVAVEYIQLVSTSFTSGTITKVVVNASGASGVSGSVSVTVGGNAFGEVQSFNDTASDKTFTGTASAGQIVVRIYKEAAATKAIYCKSVVVTTSTSIVGQDIANKAGYETAQNAVVTFAKAFNAAMDTTSGCTTNMSSAWSTATSAWSTFNTTISSLSTSEQNYAKALIAYASATWTENTDSNYEYCLERAMATYEKCVTDYDMNPFMSAVRPVERASNINPISIISSKAEFNVVAIVVVTSVISLTAIGGYFFLRKRREQN